MQCHTVGQCVCVCEVQSARGGVWGDMPGSEVVSQEAGEVGVILHTLGFKATDPWAFPLSPSLAWPSSPPQLSSPPSSLIWSTLWKSRQKDPHQMMDFVHLSLICQENLLWSFSSEKRISSCGLKGDLQPPCVALTPTPQSLPLWTPSIWCRIHWSPCLPPLPPFSCSPTSLTDRILSQQSLVFEHIY